ncbi:MAG: glycoside hydrolase family 13 protein [Oscillospiraceae bacterium]|nr:glycoside hydrolase family 13 protein [Oscillospiraceae bacterium]
MRILFDSKKIEYKNPFGCLTPGQNCTLHIQIPSTVKTSAVTLVITREDGSPYQEVPMTFAEQKDPYDIWKGTFCFSQPGLYFYYFRIAGHTGTFRLFKYGNDTNMEDGACWQVSCVPEAFTTPDWAKGGIIYQVFPDRFHKSGECDLTGKLAPYTVHQNWDEEVCWQPNEKGEVLNNDFYGGNFRGIAEKIPYIASLGTTVLYLNPIGKAFSSHRYDTGDYKTPDPMLGTMEDFSRLCEIAHSHGIKVILDGVYSHTGADSLYFNKYGSFGVGGAFRDPRSPYRSWYDFADYPNRYKSWWGFDTLPTVNKLDKGFMDYIFDGQDSVIAHWLKAGADGFRLDVADELPGEFLLKLKTSLRRIRPDALLMGEVWEDASNKIAYNTRCRYFVDGVLDSVMNYPFRTAIMNYVRGRDDGRALENTVMTVLENYPRQVVFCNMNLLGTHDTPRILTALVDDFDGSREQAARRFLSPEQTALAQARLLLATVLQYTLPGSPSIYYGDEAGCEGAKDPFNRRTYPWGRENRDILNHYQSLGNLRKTCSCLRTGDTEFHCAEQGKLCFSRKDGQTDIKIYVNQRAEVWEIPQGEVLLSHNCAGNCLAPMGYCIMRV